MENELRVVDPDCPRRVKETFDDLRESMYSTEKREKLSSTFGIEPPLQNRNLTYDETNMLYASFTGIIGLIQGDLSRKNWKNNSFPKFHLWGTQNHKSAGW